MHTLYGLGVSGWTEKARWALSHHGVEYRYREHTPLIGELALRWRTPNGPRPTTVPLLLEDARVTMGSFNIAQRAEALGTGAPPLFPASALPTIQRWEEVGDHVLRIARASVLRRMLGNPRALDESLPSFIPGFLRAVSRPTARMGVSFLARKHSAVSDPEAAIRDTVIPALERLRAELRGRPYLMDEGFTYADITACTMLQFARPMDEAWWPLAPATREVWHHESLAAAFPDLLEWRAALYEKHRRPPLRVLPSGANSASAA
ncbi:glutathione S-transferase family protein [Myxococcus landrumensis]|uniref:Glutathione S-transferase family protein n=1 Tax=Myxococcus landrumensis TaxID=2813577 RepID=A0ABX7N1N2_9BACT|nr:glutathione S-transferase C-terminal domain-containing protein [Myxococcus landrumus]QSQ12627.1 glutathione S-transferase family protein [Myxococcus landrumus]